MSFGTLPKIYSLLLDNNTDEAREVLKSYVYLYLKEEIQQEAAVRNVGSFSRFIEIAAQFNAQQAVYSNIASSSSVPRSTVTNYFDILEDTLIAKRISEYKKKRKSKSKPKLYFFDCGIVRAILDRTVDKPTKRRARSSI